MSLYVPIDSKPEELLRMLRAYALDLVPEQGGVVLSIADRLEDTIVWLNEKAADLEAMVDDAPNQESISGDIESGIDRFIDDNLDSEQDEDTIATINKLRKELTSIQF